MLTCTLTYIITGIHNWFSFPWSSNLTKYLFPKHLLNESKLWQSTWCFWVTGKCSNFKIISFTLFGLSVLFAFNLLSWVFFFFFFGCHRILIAWFWLSTCRVVKFFLIILSIIKLYICFHFSLSPHISSIIYVAVLEVCNLSHNYLIWVSCFCSCCNGKCLTKMNVKKTLYLQLQS